MQTNAGSVGYDNVATATGWPRKFSPPISPRLGLNQTYSVRRQRGHPAIPRPHLWLDVDPGHAQRPECRATGRARSSIAATWIPRRARSTSAPKLSAASPAPLAFNFYAASAGNYRHALALLGERRQLLIGCHLSIDSGAAGRLCFRLDESHHLARSIHTGHTYSVTPTGKSIPAAATRSVPPPEPFPGEAMDNNSTSSWFNTQTNPDSF